MPGPLRKTAYLFLATAGLWSCDGVGITTTDPSTTTIDLNGLWEGTASGTAFEMTLRHDTLTSEVSGFGAAIRTGGSQAFRVEGLVDDDQDIVTLLLEFATPTVGGETAITLIYYRARPVGADRLQGTLDGGGFTQGSLVLDRSRIFQ